MTAEQIKELQRAVSRAHWDMTAADFALATGQPFTVRRSPDDWQEFQALYTALAAIDAETLAAVLSFHRLAKSTTE